MEDEDQMGRIREALRNKHCGCVDGKSFKREMTGSVIGSEYALVEMHDMQRYPEVCGPPIEHETIDFIYQGRPYQEDRWYHAHYGKELYLVNMEKGLVRGLWGTEYHETPRHETFTNLALEETSDFVVVRFDWDLGGGRTRHAKRANVNESEKGSRILKFQWQATQRQGARELEDYKLIRVRE